MNNTQNLINRKNTIMQHLNAGKLSLLDGRALVQDCRKAGADCMADDMEKRLDHYALVWRGKGGK